MVIGVGSRRAEQALGLHGIEAAVAERVAAQQPPAASTSPRSMPYSRIACDGVGRARRLVLAAPRQRRRDHALVGDDRRDATRRAHHAPVAPPRRPPTSRRARPARRARPRGPRARPARAPRGARPRRRPGRAAAARPAARTPRCSRRLTRLRSTAPPTLRDTDSPRRGAVGRLAARTRAGSCRGRGSGCRPSGPGGRRARTPRCATGARACGRRPTARGKRSTAVRRSAACGPCPGGA